MDEKTAKKAIEILKAGGKIRFPGLIDKFVWANTTEPKYKVGDPVLFEASDISLSRGIPASLVAGMDVPERIKAEAATKSWVKIRTRVDHAVGTVTKVQYALQDHNFFYEIEYEVEFDCPGYEGDTLSKHKAYSYQRTLEPAQEYAINRWSQLGTINLG